MASIFTQFGAWVRRTRAKDAEFKAYQAACAADNYIVHSTDAAFDMFRRSIAAACLQCNRETYEARITSLEPQ